MPFELSTLRAAPYHPGAGDLRRRTFSREPGALKTQDRLPDMHSWFSSCLCSQSVWL